MKQFIVMSDIHSNLFNYKISLEYLEKKFPDINEYIFLGDYILNGFDGNVILEDIKSKKGYVIAGNKEEFFQKQVPENYYSLDQWKDLIYNNKILTIENRKFIKSLSNTKIIEIEGVKILLCHGRPYHAFSNIINKDDFEIFDDLINKYSCDMYFFGHTHQAFKTFYKGKWFINAGSVGMPLNNKQKINLGILKIDQGNIAYNQIDIPYDYYKFEEYYKNSEYYKFVGSFAHILLMNMRDNYDYTKEFIQFVSKKAKENNIDITNGVPNELWNKSYKEYINIKRF